VHAAHRGAAKQRMTLQECRYAVGSIVDYLQLRPLPEGTQGLQVMSSRMFFCNLTAARPTAYLLELQVMSSRMFFCNALRLYHTSLDGIKPLTVEHCSLRKRMTVVSCKRSSFRLCQKSEPTLAVR